MFTMRSARFERTHSETQSTGDFADPNEHVRALRVKSCDFK